MLDAQIDRKLDRVLLTVGRKSRAVEIGETAIVEPLLDTGDALVVDVDVADDVRHFGPARIHALVLGQKAEARPAKPVHFLLLARGNLALQPDEAAPRGEPFAQIRV